MSATRRTVVASDSIELAGATPIEEVVTPVVPETSISLQQKNNAELVTKQKQRMALADTYKNAKRVGVSGSPMYAGYFGNIMPIILNGIRIDIPLDGRRYDVPEQFANIFVSRLRSVDADLAMQKRMSDVTKNKEAFAGELNLVSLSQ